MAIAAGQFPQNAGIRRHVLVPLTAHEASLIPAGASLVLSGKASFSLSHCPTCGGSTTIKCPFCKKGLVAGPPQVVHVPASNNPSGGVYNPAGRGYSTTVGRIASNNLNQMGANQQVPAHDIYVPTTVPCPVCNGSGRIPCNACGQGGGNAGSTQRIPAAQQTALTYGRSRGTTASQIVNRLEPCDNFENWDIFDFLHIKQVSSAPPAPANAVMFLSHSQGTHRCYLLLKDMQVKIRNNTGESALNRKGLSTAFAKE
jgi:hypothetical protein